MKTVIRLVSLFAVLGMIGALLSGCEDSDVTVPSSGVINMNAQPGAIQIDKANDPANPDGIIEKTSIITATVFDDRNLPQKGVTVDFDAASGVPMDPPTGTTDTNGRVQTILTVTENDVGTVGVTARSGVVTGALSIDVSLAAVNVPPTAVMVMIPGQQGQVGDIITFDGSASLDPDSNITCYQWEIESDNPDNPATNPEIIQGRAASGFNKIFTNEQTIAINLRVSDNPDPDNTRCATVDSQTPGSVEPPEYFDDDAARDQYPILCNNPPPTAVISGPPIILATGSPSTLTSVTLNGTLSFDGETPIDRYVWNCGNEFSPLPVQPGDNSVVICRYRLGTYTATLNVTDQGTGQINPGTGTFDCQKTSDAASVSVVVATP